MTVSYDLGEPTVTSSTIQGKSLQFPLLLSSSFQCVISHEVQVLLFWFIIQAVPFSSVIFQSILWEFYKINEGEWTGKGNIMEQEGKDQPREK